MTEEQMDRVRENDNLLADASRRLRVPRQQVPTKLASMVSELKRLKQELGAK